MWYHQALFLERLIAMVDIAAAVMNTTAADAKRSVGSNNTSGCGSHVPGKVQTDGCDAKNKVSPPM